MSLSPNASPRWPQHVVRAGRYRYEGNEVLEPAKHARHVEPWLAALFQAEHLNLVVGNGLTAAVTVLAQTDPVSMQTFKAELPYADSVKRAAEQSARAAGRNTSNLEDQLRAANELIAGLRVFANGDNNGESEAAQRRRRAEGLLMQWEKRVAEALSRLLKDVLMAERGVLDAVVSSDKRATDIRRLLGSFLLSFATRAPSRDRLHIFTTNYDRLMEYGCDLIGLRIMDRFVGQIAPVFRSSRLAIDFHYNPPGILGEPRFLEGVVRLTKLHGSLDWQWAPEASGRGEVQRTALPFGGTDAGIDDPGERLLVYPNAAKDTETLEYPYAELFRDFAGAVCRPNSVVATYGYGFGDDHVNRVLLDMLSIPSTHLVILSHGEAEGRIPALCDRAGREHQITLLIGKHFGELENLVNHYLPRPTLDLAMVRMAELLKRREQPPSEEWTDARNGAPRSVAGVPGDGKKEADLMAPRAEPDNGEDPPF